MSNLIKIENETHLYKDPNTGAILNKDVAGYQAYLAQAAANEAKRQKALSMEQEIDQLKDDVSEIKNMLRILIENR